MGAEPVLGFLGETGEKCLALIGGGCAGFFVGGPLGALGGAGSAMTVVHHRWQKFNQYSTIKESLKKIYDYAIKFSFPSLLAFFSLIGFIGFRGLENASCAHNIKSSRCSTDFTLEISSLIAFGVFTFWTAYIWTQAKQDND